MRRGHFVTGICLSFFLLWSVSAVIAQEEPVVACTVEDGDCLIHICNRLLEEPARWMDIARVNRLKNPDLIRPGDTLLFPLALMKGTPAEGTVSFVKGDVSSRTIQDPGWKALALQDRLPEGSVVKTGKESSVEIRFDDGSSVLQRAGTTVGIKSARKISETHSRYSLDLPGGRILSRVRRATGQETLFRVETPSAICGVRGTMFRSTVTDTGDSSFEVLEGALAVESQETSVTLAGGEGTFVRRGDVPVPSRRLLPPPVPVDVPPVYAKLPIRLTLSPVAGASSYRVVLARDEAVRDIAAEKVVGAAGTCEISDIADGSYFLQSSSIDDLGLEGIPSPPRTVRVRTNPVAPFVRIPSERAVYPQSSLTCQWLAVADAARYRVQVAEDPEFLTIVKDQGGIEKTSLSTGEMGFKTYYFRVSSIAADGYQGAWSDALAFTLEMPPVKDAPPVETPSIERDRIRVRWRDLGSDVSYRAQISGDGAFKELLLDEIVKSPEVTLQRPKTAGIYHVRTSAIDRWGRQGGFSQAQTFEIRKPATPVMEPPVLDRKEVRCQWQDLGEEFTYHVRMSRDAEFQNILADRMVSRPEITFPAPKEPGTYCLHASALDSWGCEGDFSAARTFEIRRSFLPALLGISGGLGLLLFLGL